MVTLGPGRVEARTPLLMDHDTVGHCAGAYLYDRGCRRIGVVMPEESGLEVYARPRLAGVREAPARHGRRRDGAAARPHRGGRRRTGRRWPESNLDGVFAYNDEYAMLLMRALRTKACASPRTSP